MKHTRFIGFISLAAAVLLSPFLETGQVSAAPAATTKKPPQHAIVQELHVTAVVPVHRDIIVDLRGRIVRITSNTTQDVAPRVFLLDTRDDQEQPLTADLYEQYRTHVPVGTTKTGVLYQQSARGELAALISPATGAQQHPLARQLRSVASL